MVSKLKEINRQRDGRRQEGRSGENREGGGARSGWQCPKVARLGSMVWVPGAVGVSGE